MRISIVTPPAPIVDVAYVRKFIGDAGSDEMLEMLISAVQAEIEPPDSYVGRSFGVQTLQMTFGADVWRCRRLPLWYPPIREVVSVHYCDAAGVEQELAPASWRMVGEAVTPTIGSAWPDVECRPDAARVVYEAGYDAPPEAVKLAIVMSLQGLKTFSRSDVLVRREETTGVGATEWDLSAAASSAVAQAVDRLLAPYRILRV